jgi:hypothetical protein
MAHFGLIETKEDMDAGGLDVCIHNPDAFARHGNLSGEVCGGVGFSCTPAKRVN